MAEDAAERSAPLEVRRDGRTLSGYAIRYGDPNRTGTEVFEPGAFRSAAGVPVLLQHDPNSVVSEHPDIELRLEGVWVSVDVDPDSAAGQLAARGALTGWSVGFHALEQRHDQGVRRLAHARLGHIGLVDRGNYPTATVEVRADVSGPIYDLRRIW